MKRFTIAASTADALLLTGCLFLTGCGQSSNGDEMSMFDAKMADGKMAGEKMSDPDHRKGPRVVKRSAHHAGA